MLSSHLILCCPLLLLPSIPPSIRVFSNESTLRMRWPKYCSFSFSIIPSKETPELISFRMDWLDLLEVQGTLKSLLQHHTSKASILWHSAFFTVQLSLPYKYWYSGNDANDWYGKVPDWNVSWVLNAFCDLVMTSRKLSACSKQMAHRAAHSGFIRVRLLGGNCVGRSVSSAAQSHLTLCNPVDCSTPDLPVHHQLPEF